VAKGYFSNSLPKLHLVYCTGISDKLTNLQGEQLTGKHRRLQVQTLVD